VSYSQVLSQNIPNRIVCGILNDHHNSSDYTASNDTMINDYGYGRKWSWPNLRSCPGICLDGLRKITENAIRIVGLRAEI
jgi:hypothetical protein